jgi:hypothetical protein
MGLFSSRNADWEEEFDARLNDPTVKKDVMKNWGPTLKPTETRVADDDGTMRRRNGEGCCGCGQWSDHHGNSPDYRDRDRPTVTNSRVDHHDDGEHGDEEPRRGFLGIF